MININDIKDTQLYTTLKIDLYPRLSLGLFFAAKLTMEIIKIVAVKIFLEFLAERFLNAPKKVAPSKVYKSVISGPAIEEVIFRIYILQGIHLVQNTLNEFDNESAFEEEGFKPRYRIHLNTSFSHSSTPQYQQSDVFVIPICVPVVEEIICRAYVGLIYKVNQIFSYAMSKIFGYDIEEDEKTENEQIQQIFRIHLAALIFAASHLGNDHANTASALKQFCWTFVGGIVYGYLTEKYQSLAPGILFHGFNNALVTAAKIYPEMSHYIVLALLANRVASYILGVTSIEVIPLVKQIYDVNLFIPRLVNNLYFQEDSSAAISDV